MKKRIKDIIGRKPLVIDGAMGTMLQKRGLKGGEAPDLYNITHPDIITEIHEEYLNAGVDIITTNTFGTNSVKLKSDKYNVSDVAKAGVFNARKAVDKTERDCYVAFDIGPTGKMMYPLGDLTFTEAYKSFSEVAIAAKESGADLFIIETMSDIYEAKAAILACRENTDLPIICTVTLEAGDRTLTGSSVDIIGNILQSLGADVCGFNCSRGPKEMSEPLRKICAAVTIPVVIQPNAGMPVVRDGETTFPLSPEEYAKSYENLFIEGVSLFGGCCGTSPEHMKNIVKLVKDKFDYINAERISNKKDVICSSSMSADLINSKCQPETICINANSDVYDVQDEIFEALDEGYDIIKLQVSDDFIGEASKLEEAICDIQSVIKQPIIFCGSEAAVNLAKRFYNGSYID